MARKSNSKKSGNNNTNNEKIITEQYRYENKNGEQLLNDLSNEPLTKSTQKNETNNIKSIMNTLVSEDRPFYMHYKNQLIFDSDINNKEDLVFEDDYFYIKGERFEYDGLVFHYKDTLNFLYSFI